MITLENVDTYNELRKLLYTHTFYLEKGKLVAVNDKSGEITVIKEIEEDVDYSGVLELGRDVTVNDDGGVYVSLAFVTPISEQYEVDMPVSNTYHLPVERMLVEPIEETFVWVDKIRSELTMIESTFLGRDKVVALPPYDPQDPSFTLDILERNTSLGMLLVTYYRKEGVEGIKPIDYIFV